MRQSLHELRAAVIAELSPEERLRGLSPEERLRGLSPEERLRGLTLEERLWGLSGEERLRVLKAVLRMLSDEQRKRLFESSQHQLPESSE